MHHPTRRTASGPLLLSFFSIACATGAPACSSDAAAPEAPTEQAQAWGTPWTMDGAFADELREVTGDDPVGLTAFWRGTNASGRYDGAYFQTWPGERIHVGALVITGSGKADAGQNDLKTFPFPDGATIIPCLQSVGGIQSAYMIRTSNGIEARKRLAQYDVTGSELFGHSAGAWVAVVMGILGRASRVDVYGVPFFFPIHGELTWGRTTIGFHTHAHDPVGFGFDVPAMLGAMEYNQIRYGDAQREHDTYRDPEPAQTPLTEDEWTRVREYLVIRLEIALGKLPIDTCWGKPCVADHMGGSGL